MYARESATTDELVDINHVAQWQHRVKRMAYDVEGQVESNDFQKTHGIKKWSYFSLWTVVSVGGINNDELVLQTGDTDPAEVTWYTKTQGTENPLVTIDGYIYHTAVQPWDVIRFLGGVLETSCQPVIVQVLGCGVASGLASNQIKVKVDKSCENVLKHVDPEDTSPISVQVFNPGAFIENWDYIIQPDMFLGQYTQVTVDASEVPTDGVYLLEADTPVMHPGGFDPLTEMWTFEGRVGAGAWESVAQADDRLFVLPDKAYVCFKTTKPAEGIASLTLSDDLTATYSEFRITYYKRVTGGTNCGPVGYGRCKWSVPDPSQSVGNYKALAPGTASEGVAVSANNTHYVCLKRIVDTHTEPEDTDLDGLEDTVENVQVKASGAVRFPASGQCLQYGCCDQWTAAEGDTGRDAPTSYSSLARAIDDVWGAADWNMVRSYLDTIYYMSRLGQPSIAWHAGYVDLSSSVTITGGEIRFGGYGAWGHPYTYTDPVTGDQTLHMMNGLFELYNPGDFDAGGTGLLPTYITDWNPKRDPINAAATYSQDELERIGFAVDRDTGAKSGYGMSAGESYALPAQNIVLPKFDIALTDTVQTRVMGSFERKSAGANAIVRFFPLRQELKSEISLGSRVLALVPESLGSGRYKLTFKNGTHTHTTTSGGSDIIDSWEGGGVYPICPTLLQEINDYNEPNKSTGSRLRGAWRGDAAGVGDRRVLIESVTPHGGVAAADWGSAFTPSDSFCIGRNYLSFGKNQDIAIVYDDAEGTIAGLDVDDTVDFYKLSVVTLPGAVLEWVAYGSDNWQTVDADKAYYGDGTYEILDSWFADKPAEICFRLTGAKLMDHRGGISAPVWNKTEAFFGVDWWVRTGMASLGEGAAFSFYKEVSQYWTRGYDPVTCAPTQFESEVFEYEETGGSYGNALIIEQGELDGNAATSSVKLSLTSSYAGAPAVILRIPDGTVILEAKAQINGGGLTREVINSTYAVVDCSSTIIVPESTTTDTTIEDVSYSFIGFTSPTDYVIIGSVPSAGLGSEVVDITDIANAIYAARSVGTYPYGYGLIYTPPSADLPGEAPTRTTTVCPGNFCEGSTYQEYSGYSKTTLTWGSLSIGDVCLKLQYPDEDQARTIIIPRLPSMKPLPV